jgi:hypothetical protein
VPVKSAGRSRSIFIRGRQTTGERVPRFLWKSHALCCDDLFSTAQRRRCLELDGSERLRRRDWSGQHSPNFPSGLDARVEHSFRRIGLRGQSLCTTHKPNQPDTREATGHNRCNQVKGEHGQQTVTRHRRTLERFTYQVKGTARSSSRRRPVLNDAWSVVAARVRKKARLAPDLYSLTSYSMSKWN